MSNEPARLGLLGPATSFPQQSGVHEKCKETPTSKCQNLFRFPYRVLSMSTFRSFRFPSKL